MFKPTFAFSGFSVSDLAKAKTFYTETLGLEAKDTMGGFELNLPGGMKTYVYGKPNHEPATYTMLDFVVEDIDATVDALMSQGVTFEKYPGMHQDDKAVARGRAADMGPDIAWFKDPSGNILAVLQTD